jgi:hypothetical protein
VKTSRLVDRDRLLLLFPSVPAVHLPVTCKAKQQHKQFRLSFFFQICHGLFWICFVADQLLPLILFSLVPCTGSKECWRLATGGEGDRLLLWVAGLWALLKTGWRRLRRRQLGLPPCSVWGKKGTAAGLCFFYRGK